MNKIAKYRVENGFLTIDEIQKEKGKVYFVHLEKENKLYVSVDELEQFGTFHDAVNFVKTSGLNPEPMFHINYNNGMKNDLYALSFDQLEWVEDFAEEFMSYTGHDVVIYDHMGKEVSRSEWYGVKPEEDDEVLMQFDDYGYYTNWKRS